MGAEKRRCVGCGKDYWWPGAMWQHEGCKVVERKQRWSREAYNAYMREYMRRRRK